MHGRKRSISQSSPIKLFMARSSVTEVNGEGDYEEGLREEVKKKHALDLKFYNAGGCLGFNTLKDGYSQCDGQNWTCSTCCKGPSFE